MKRATTDDEVEQTLRVGVPLDDGEDYEMLPSDILGYLLKFMDIAMLWSLVFVSTTFRIAIRKAYCGKSTTERKRLSQFICNVKHNFVTTTIKLGYSSLLEWVADEPRRPDKSSYVTFDWHNPYGYDGRWAYESNELVNALASSGSKYMLNQVLRLHHQPLSIKSTKLMSDLLQKCIPLNHAVLAEFIMSKCLNHEDMSSESKWSTSFELGKIGSIGMVDLFTKYPDIIVYSEVLKGVIVSGNYTILDFFASRHSTSWFETKFKQMWFGPYSDLMNQSNRFTESASLEWLEKRGYMPMIEGYGDSFAELFMAFGNLNGLDRMYNYITRSGGYWMLQKIPIQKFLQFEFLDILDWLYEKHRPMMDNLCRSAWNNHGRYTARTISWMLAHGVQWSPEFLIHSLMDKDLDLALWGIQNGCTWGEPREMYKLVKSSNSIAEWAKNNNLDFKPKIWTSDDETLLMYEIMTSVDNQLEYPDGDPDDPNYGNEMVMTALRCASDLDDSSESY